MRLRTTWVGVLAAAAVIAGCGGDDDEGAKAAKKPLAPTKAEYVAKLDALCKEGTPTVARINRKLARIDTQMAKPESEEPAKSAIRESVAVYEQLISLREDATTSLRGEAPPKSGGATAYFDSRDAVTAALQDRRLAAYTTSYPVSTHVARIERTTGRLTRLNERQAAAAKAYGLKVCSR
jgi:hypothetical protein